MIELLEMKILGWIRATIVLYQTLVVRGHDIATKVIFPSCIVHNYILPCHGSADNAKWVYFLHCNTIHGENTSIMGKLFAILLSCKPHHKIFL